MFQSFQSGKPSIFEAGKKKKKASAKLLLQIYKQSPSLLEDKTPPCNRLAARNKLCCLWMGAPLSPTI